jgi:hypothetical protein
MPRGREACGELAIRYGLRTVAAFPILLVTTVWLPMDRGRLLPMAGFALQGKKFDGIWGGIRAGSC